MGNSEISKGIISKQRNLGWKIKSNLQSRIKIELLS